MPATVADNLARIRDRIAGACARAGRDPAAVTLVAVSKTHPVAAIEAALAAGQTVFGENRVQEAAEKFPPLRARHPGLRLHLIGALQTNKARDAARVADVIESLDRDRLAVALAGADPCTLLVQVNVGDEPQKAGIAKDALEGFLRDCAGRHGLRVTGLMCIPPAGADPRPHFAWLASAAARHALGTVSMGMSEDFETAIEEGATHVRVGSAIFGARPTG